jgi:hypothetical protein
MRERRHEEIIVVGNGGELVGKGLGAAIDAFGTVIRCNDFRPTLGKDFGRRADIIVWNQDSAKGRELADAFDAELWFSPKIRPKPSRGLVAIQLVIERLAPKELYVVGMENLLDGVKQGEPSYSAKRKRWGDAMHHWDQEKCVLDRLLAENNVTLRCIRDV